MKTEPLVSVIVPTKNSGEFLERCLQSINDQTYPNVEFIVVDNFSTDNTVDIAKNFTDKIFKKGPERSTQRNFGVSQAQGEYVAIIDSDMELESDVIAACVDEMIKDAALVGLVIPEESFGEGFWAKCKQFERSFYLNVDWMEAARFFKKDTYQALGGYNESMISGEDWDLSDRAKTKGKVSRIKPFIYHNEGQLRLLDTIYKKYYYGEYLSSYTQQTSPFAEAYKRTSMASRYALFLLQPRKLFEHPFLTIGMYLMKTAEFMSLGLSYLLTLLEPELNEPLSYSNEIPFVSYIVPTYNAADYLERCLKSIYDQTYPHGKYEVIIADGGSADPTVTIAQSFSTTLIHNPARDAESGKYLAIQKAQGEILVLLDADNVIASNDWLISMVQPLLAEPNIIGVESNYLIANDFTSLNTYTTLLVIVDPLARMLASKATWVTKRNGYVIKRFSRGSAPVAGANGFLWRRSVVDVYLNHSLKKFAETNTLSVIARDEGLAYANIPSKGIYHYYCTNLRDYMAKREKIAEKFLNRLAKREYTWVSTRSSIAFTGSIIYLLFFIGPVCEAVYNYIRTRRKEWFWHPFISLITIWIYALYLAKKYHESINSD